MSDSIADETFVLTFSSASRVFVVLVMSVMWRKQRSSSWRTKEHADKAVESSVAIWYEGAEISIRLPRCWLILFGRVGV